MPMLSPLKAEISRYRRRKQHSVDGSVPGMPSYHGTSSSIVMAADAHVGQAPAHFDLYDPFGPMYEWAQPDYRPPEPWFVGLQVQPPSPERIGGPEQVSVILTDTVREQIEISRAVTSVKGEAENGVLLDQNVWGRQPSDEPHPWLDGAPVPQEMVNDAFQAAAQEQVELLMPEPATELDLVSTVAEPEPEQLQHSLEALVQEAMLLQNPAEVQNDFFSQQQMMYEEEMRQLLDPFAMPGFGPG